MERESLAIRRNAEPPVTQQAVGGPRRLDEEGGENRQARPAAGRSPEKDLLGPTLPVASLVGVVQVLPGVSPTELLDGGGGDVQLPGPKSR